MSGTGLINIIREHRLRIFTTADILTMTGMSPGAATHALNRLNWQNLIAKIKRGVWVSRLLPDLNPYEAVPYLTGRWPSYVSLYSALADYGVVEEIPQIVYAVSPAHPKRYRTSLGEFHIHHLPQNLIWGYEIKGTGQGTYPVAEPEKAFLDLVYLALTPRSPIQLPHKRGKKWTLNLARLKKHAARFKSKRLSGWLKNNRLI